jgi:hypothetical protein
VVYTTGGPSTSGDPLEEKLAVDDTTNKFYFHDSKDVLETKNAYEQKRI